MGGARVGGKGVSGGSGQVGGFAGLAGAGMQQLAAARTSITTACAGRNMAFMSTAPCGAMRMPVSAMSATCSSNERKSMRGTMVTGRPVALTTAMTSSMFKTPRPVCPRRSMMVMRRGGYMACESTPLAVSPVAM